MKNLTIRTADNLYWLGRYLQRTEILVKESLACYDDVIDRNFKSGKNLFEKLGVEIDYNNSKEFLKIATFGDHFSSIQNAISNARENAIMIRDLIKDEVFAAINDFYNLIITCKQNELSPHFLDDMLYKIDTVWGIMSAALRVEKSALFIQFGQTVEMIDLKIRLYQNENFSFDLVYYIDHLNLIGKQLNQNFEYNHSEASDLKTMQSQINSAICNIINYEN